MKKIVLLAVFVLVLAAVRSDSGVNVSSGRLNNGAETVHFTAAYQGVIGGFWTCTGERIRRRSPDPNPFTKDSEECTFTDLSTLPPGTYFGDPYFSINGVLYQWNSDYDARMAKFVFQTVTDNGDGTGHIDVLAYY
jgi:hypothetical protein